MPSTYAEPSAPPSPLVPRHEPATAARLALSAATARGAHLSGAEFPGWFRGRREAHEFRVDRIPFSALDGWAFDPATGNLGHRSGRFFTVEGLHAVADTGPGGRPHEWHQPIVKQPEVGILGILAKEFDGVLHFLMQAKMEPGNANLLQLSPTVQATRSNYTKVHQGADVKYLDYFLRPDRGRVIADVLQSEHGAWFHRKRNRNMIVETTGEVPLHDDFCWLTLGQIAELLQQDNLVNMDARTVLSCAPVRGTGPERALHSDGELLSWFTAERARHDLRTELVPLAGLPGWTRGDSSIERPDGRYFRVVAVSVVAGNREVTGWTQPLFEPCRRGVAAFVTRTFDGVRHVLAHARVEGGFQDVVELAPTVQCTPEHHAGAAPEDRPPFLDLVLSAGPDRVVYEAVHSEEGGRFLNAESRYLVVEADEAQAPTDPPPGFRWVTPAQLTALVAHCHYVNVQARSLLACLNATRDDS